MTHRLEWEHGATVLRSQWHEPTWIGHVPAAGHTDTPAGPLWVVKAACLELADLAGDDVRVRWKRHADGNGYDLQFAFLDEPAPPQRPRRGGTVMRWAPAGPA